MKNNNLVDISTINVDKSLSREEKLIEFTRQIKDPYHFTCKGYEVTVTYGTKKLTLEECLVGIFL